MPTQPCSGHLETVDVVNKKQAEYGKLQLSPGEKENKRDKLQETEKGKLKTPTVKRWNQI
jgi:hypothetical protein